MELLRASGSGRGTEVPPLLCARQRRMAAPLPLAQRPGRADPPQLADLPAALPLPLGFQRGTAAPRLLAPLRGPRRLPQRPSGVLLTRW